MKPGASARLCKLLLDDVFGSKINKIAGWLLNFGSNSVEAEIGAGVSRAKLRFYPFQFLANANPQPLFYSALLHKTGEGLPATVDYLLMICLGVRLIKLRDGSPILAVTAWKLK